METNSNLSRKKCEKQSANDKQQSTYQTNREASQYELHEIEIHVLLMNDVAVMLIYFVFGLYIDRLPYFHCSAYLCQLLFDRVELFSLLLQSYKIITHFAFSSTRFRKNVKRMQLVTDRR